MKAKKTPGDICVDCIIYFFYGLFALLCIFPFYYIFINTISGNDLVAAGQIMLLPRDIHFSNYVKVLQLRNLPNAVMVTLSRTILGTALNVLCTAFVAYGVSRRELFRRKFVYRFFIITMYFNAGLIPWYLNMRNLRLTNNFLAYVIGVISVFNLILVKTYIESVPDSLHESAEIDGAGYLLIFFRIMLPLCLPILATVAIFTAVGHWNSFMDTLMLMRNENLYTLQYILWQYLNEATALARNIQAMVAQAMTSGVASQVNTATKLTPTAVKMTIAMVVTLPVLFVYPFFQKYFVRGIMIGAVKG